MTEKKQPTWGRCQCQLHICERAQYMRPHSDRPVQPVWRGKIVLQKAHSVYYQLTVSSIRIRGWRLRNWEIEPGSSRSGSRRPFHTQGTCWNIHSCQHVAQINIHSCQHCPFQRGLPGCFALLSNGPWTCERRYGVDKVGVVLSRKLNNKIDARKWTCLRKRYQQRDLSSIAIILPQSERCTMRFKTTKTKSPEKK